MSAPFPFKTPEEHERFVASQPPGRSINHNHGYLFPCALCGKTFRTTDWPPVVCKECQEARS